MTRRHLTIRRLAALSEELSAKDLDVVATLSRMRLATTGQLERLHWADGQPVTRARRCRRTLERLVRLGVLVRLERRIGGVRSGSASYIYALGVAGQHLNGSVGPAGGRSVRRPWTPSLPFVTHILAVTELYVQLVERSRDDLDLELVRFDTEPACWRSYGGPSGGRLVLKPDAYCVLARADYEEHRFIEVDRATESLTTIAKKLTAYRQYWMSGQEQHRQGVFPGVLFIVPDQRRLARVVEECGRQPAEVWRLFQVVLWHEAVGLMVEVVP